MLTWKSRYQLKGTDPPCLIGEEIESNYDEPILVSLHLRRKRELPALPLRQPMALSELLDNYGASGADFELVRAFAEHFELTVHSVSLAQRIVRLSGSCRAFEAAFAVKLRFVKHADRIVRVRSGPIMLCRELDGVISGVVGLDDHAIARPHFRLSRLTTRASEKPDAFDGVQLASIYNFPASGGQGQTIALIELGGGFLPSDLVAFFASLNLAVPVVKTVSVMGGSNSPGVDSGADTEVALDVEVAGAVAPDCTIVVYFAPNTEQGFFEALSSAVHDAVNQPGIVSISWGAAEAQWTGQMMTSMNDVFQSAAALGISAFVAAGDDGANDNVNDGKTHVDFPASSPSAIGCGGTTLTMAGGARVESAWNSSFLGNGATGGGISDAFSRPSYQQSTSMPTNLGGGMQGRGVPDVAAVADPETGYAVYVDGAWTIVGGTSAVAPLYGGLMARINNVSGQRCGLINLKTYGSTLDSGFNDIVVGNNSADGITGYSAGPGWDAVTGWGSPNGKQLLQVLLGLS